MDRIMVLILDGNLEKGKRVMTNLFKAFETIKSSLKSDFFIRRELPFFMRALNVLSYQVFHPNAYEHRD